MQTVLRFHCHQVAATLFNGGGDCLSGDISNPDIFFIMQIYSWQFHNLIQTYDYVYKPYRSVESKGCDKTKGDREAPHSPQISLHVKLGIPSGTENAIKDCSIYRLSHEIKAKHNHHKLQVFPCGI